MQFKFIEVNLPFSWGDIEYTQEEYDAPNFTEKKCFRDVHELSAGMLLDCLADNEREMILVGHINQCTGHCGCCNTNIKFVYRYCRIPLPKCPRQTLVDVV